MAQAAANKPAMTGGKPNLVFFSDGSDSNSGAIPPSTPRSGGYGVVHKAFVGNGDLEEGEVEEIIGRG